jgi:hypothetical protein
LTHTDQSGRESPTTMPDRPRGRPRTVGGSKVCDRCTIAVSRHRVRWPTESLCGACFTAAVRTYGRCALCGIERMTPGLSPARQSICRECAGITTALDCTNCGREAERLRGGHCARVVTADLTAALRPHDPPDLRLKRLVAAQASPLPSTARTAAARPSAYVVDIAHDASSPQTSPRLYDRTIPQTSDSNGSSQNWRRCHVRRASLPGCEANRLPSCCRRSVTVS